MKKIVFFLVALMLLGVLGQESFAQVKVKFVLNTATLSDTITSTTSKLRLTGDDTAITSWGNGVDMANIGGDYWSIEKNFFSGDTVRFKFRANGGWEGNLSNPHGTDVATNDRVVIVGSQDTTLPMQYYNGSTSKKDQYWRPFDPTPDSMFTVWVRVNMQAVIENKTHKWQPTDVDSVAIMGFTNAANTISYGPDASWNASLFIKQESNPFFFSGRVRIRRSLLADTLLNIPYKFRLGSDWSRDELSGKNRLAKFWSGNSDTTLAYVYYNDTKPVVRTNSDTCVITFDVDVSQTSASGGFDQGDTIVVQTGFFNTAVENGREKQMELLIGTAYEVTDTVITSVGKKLDYQYYLVKNGARIRENYFNFYYDGITSSERERRQVTVTSKSLIVTDDKTSASDAHRQPQFESQKPLAQQVTVKWEVNLKPAYRKVAAGGTILDEQGDATVQDVDTIAAWGVGINGPATNLPDVYPIGDWATWNPDIVADTSKRKMWDDGTHGDLIAGDTIYTVELTYAAGERAGRVYKFGIRGGDNEGGNGKAFGNNHSANISDLNPTYTIYTEWGSINPAFYTEWYGTTDVLDYLNSIPGVFKLEQNYPNPFNPTTSIRYSVPKQSAVKLAVYNVIGQQVATLVNEVKDKGNHIVQFNASSLSSGIYFYKLTAGNFTSVKKMMLVK